MSDQIKVVRLKSGTGRYYVTLSHRPEPITVSDELVWRHRLKEGIVLTAPQAAQLEAEAELAECDRSATRMLGLREHSVGELKAKLKHRGFAEESIKAVMNRLKAQGLLDDAHYAQHVARGLLERNPAGRGYVVAYLQHKLIPRALAEETADMLLADQDEIDLAVRSLERRWKTLGQFDLERARSKAYTYLGRRGIGYSAAKAAFDRLWNRAKKDGND